MSQKPILHYFNGKGRAEIIRLTFAAAGVDYVDDRIELEKWPELKKTTAPTGVAPWVDTEHGAMVQSNAIARFFARKYGLMGQSDWEYYLVERAVSQLDDLFNGLIDALHTPEDKRKETVEKFAADKGLSLTTNLAAFLKDGGSSGLFVSSGLTLADVYCINVFEILGSYCPDLAAKFPELTRHTDKVKSVSPKVAEWLQKRPKTEF